MTDHAFPEAWRRGLYETIMRRRDMRSFSSRSHPGRDPCSYPPGGASGRISRTLATLSFLVIEDREVRAQVRAHVEEERLRAADAFEKERREQYLSLKLEGILDAPINLCVTCDRERFGPAVIGRNTIPETAVYSTCYAIQNLWLAARAEGLGVGWVSIMEPAVLRTILRITDRIVSVAYLCGGFVESFSERPILEIRGWLPRLPLHEVVFHDRWDERPRRDLLRALETSRIDGEQATSTLTHSAESRAE